MSRIRVTWKPGTVKRPETVYVDYYSTCLKLSIEEAYDLFDGLATQLDSYEQETA